MSEGKLGLSGYDHIGH